MTDNKHKRKITSLDDLSPKDMLGIYARYHGWAYQLLSQRMNIKIKAQSMTKAPTRQKYGSIMLTYLKGMAYKSYAESQQDDPSFTRIIFHQDQKILKQERISAIRYDIGNLSYAREFLSYLLVHDKSLQPLQESKVALNGDDQNHEQTIIQATTLPNSLGHTEEDHDEAKSELKPFQVYSTENIISCLNGLSLCQGLFKNKIRQTTAKDKVSEFRENHGPIYADALAGSLSTITGDQRGFITSDLMSGYKSTLASIAYQKPDENTPLISVHPV